MDFPDDAVGFLDVVSPETTSVAEGLLTRTMAFSLSPKVELLVEALVVRSQTADAERLLDLLRFNDRVFISLEVQLH